MEIVTQIVYSNSPAEYDYHVQELRDTKLQSVIQYYEQNWEPIKEQFVTCFKNSILTFGETTTNRWDSSNITQASYSPEYITPTQQIS